MTVASNVSLLSGPYSGPIYTTIPALDPQFGPATVILSNGRSVPNPLATTYRFAYATRGEGQITAPTMITWNARLQKDFRFGARRLVLTADVFNLLNGAADQQFKDAGNVLGNANYAMKDGQWQGANRQAPRMGQVSVRFQF